MKGIIREGQSLPHVVDDDPAIPSDIQLLRGTMRNTLNTRRRRECFANQAFQDPSRLTQPAGVMLHIPDATYIPFPSSGYSQFYPFPVPPFVV